MRRQNEDTNMWIQGRYFYTALDVLVEQVISGFSKKKTNAKYPEEPMHVTAEKKKQELKELTEQEKRRQTELLFMRLKTMQTNYELSKAGDK